MDGPGRRAGAEVARVGAVLELSHPFRLAIGIPRHQATEATRDEIGGGIDGIHPIRLPPSAVRRILWPSQGGERRLGEEARADRDGALIDIEGRGMQIASWSIP